MTDRKLELATDPYGSDAALRPGITSIRRTQPSRPGTPLFLMYTQCPAVIAVWGPMNQPVPIHRDPSAAVINSDECTRQG